MVRLSPGEDSDLDAKKAVERVDRSSLMRRALAKYVAVEPERVSEADGADLGDAEA